MMGRLMSPKGTEIVYAFESVPTMYRATWEKHGEELVPIHEEMIDSFPEDSLPLVHEGNGSRIVQDEYREEFLLKDCVWEE